MKWSLFITRAFIFTGCTEREQVQTVYTMNLFETKSTAAQHTSSCIEFKVCILIRPLHTQLVNELLPLSTKLNFQTQQTKI